MMTKRELVLAVKTALIPCYLLILYVAAQVLAQSYSVFDYGRF